MADPFASPYDVAVRWRPLTAAEESVAEVLVFDASTLIRQRFPGIDGQVTSGAVDPDILTMVVAGMVKRAMLSPTSDGVSQQSQTAGPFSQSQTYANPLQNVFLTAADLVLILGYQPAGGTHHFANTTIRKGGDGYPATFYGSGF